MIEQAFPGTSSKASVTVRRAVAADAPLIWSFVKELALYEREPDAVIATVEDFLRDGFGEHPQFHVLIAEQRTETEVKPAGFAFYFFHYRTWRGRSVLYLEDLFVRPEFRGLGIGRLLLHHLARESLSLGCCDMRWQVLDWNVDAIAFYEKLGARLARQWLTVCLEGDPLIRLAEEG